MKKHFLEQSIIFFSVSKWLIISALIGIVIGAVVTSFINILQYSEDSRGLLGFHYYYLLPFALMLTIWITKTFAPNAKGHGTEIKTCNEQKENCFSLPLLSFSMFGLSDFRFYYVSYDC